MYALISLHLTRVVVCGGVVQGVHSCSFFVFGNALMESFLGGDGEGGEEETIGRRPKTNMTFLSLSLSLPCDYVFVVKKQVVNHHFAWHNQDWPKALSWYVG